MTIEEMDEAYSNLKTEYFDIQYKFTTAEQCIDCYKKDILKLNKQLKIAVEGLMTILNDGDDYWDKCQAQYYLTQIKELDK